MKIEDSPFQFKANPVREPWAKPPGAHHALDDLDLAFLDLLNDTEVINTPQRIAKPASPEETAEKAPQGSTTAESKEAKPKTATVIPLKTKPAEEDPRAMVEKEMTLLKTDLTAEDIQYMKQAVIPGLPILTGSVSAQSIFPAGADGQISYRGHEISPKLAELIEKGHKTGKPVRIELDPHSAVVLKIRNGRVSAEFLSTDKASIIYLQQELDNLKDRMAARNLPVDDLTSRYSREQRRQQSHEDTEE